VLFGLGTGLYATPRVMVVSRVYPRRATTALGVVFAAGNVGTSTLPALAGVAAGAVGWRAGFLAVAPAFLVAAVGLRTALPAGPTEPEAGTDAAGLTDALGTAAAELRRRSVRYAAVVLVGFGFAYQGLVAFLPTYLVDRTALGPAAASGLFGLLFASGLVAQLLAGGLADRIGRRPVLLASLALTLAGLAGLVTVRGRLALAVVVAVLGLQIGFWPVITAYAYDTLSDGDRGGGFGLVRTVYLCLGATGPLVVGALFDAGRYENGIGLLAAAFALVGVLCLRLPAVRTPPAQS
jgi:MFS family permease